MKTEIFYPEQFIPEDFWTTYEALGGSAFYRHLFTPANPFWQQGRALVCWEENEFTVVGFFHPEFHRHALGFGFYQVSSRVTQTEKVFASIYKWAQTLGLRTIVGPINLKTCYDYRLSVDSFDVARFWGEPQNSSREVDFLREAGFLPSQKYVTDTICDLQGIYHQAERRLKPVAQSFQKIKIQPYSHELWKQHQAHLLDLVNKIFTENPGFMPVHSFDMDLLYTPDLLKHLCAETSMFLYAQQKIVGFWFNFVDPRQPQRLLIKTIALLPEYRFSGLSFVSSLWHVFTRSQKYKEISFCLMTEENMAHRLTKKYTQKTQLYSLFAKQI